MLCTCFNNITMTNGNLHRDILFASDIVSGDGPSFHLIEVIVVSLHFDGTDFI